MNEVTAKRNMRTQSIETAMRLIGMIGEPASAKKLIEYADEIYNFVTRDGSLADLAEESNIKLI